ncbi:hypothetical protein D3C78_1258630 [compost metagenome]
MPTTVKRFMRGNMPAGVTVTSGATKVSLSPIPTPSLAAALSPIMMPKSPGARASSLPSRMKLSMIDTCRSWAGSMPLSSTFCTLPSWVNNPCIWVKGATATTCGFCFTCLARAGQSLIGWPVSKVAWGTMPNTRVRIS